MKSDPSVDHRYKTTINFFEKVLPGQYSILDLGTHNDLTNILLKKGHRVINTMGQDLDLEPESIIDYKVDVVTAFEILEHLVSPFPLLKMLPSNKLIATVPLKLWFVKTYRNEKDPWDRHFHEFEDWQFDWLLEKAGWTIRERIKWVSPSNRIGLRPLLRRFTPRYYGVYAEREH
jgi:hypothetical protein